ncbi:MAG: hypothetical protein L6406_00205 [Desulfobacterales bacterium]|nr:hypothetical protein [Desulfobacterales bacterium]
MAEESGKIFESEDNRPQVSPNMRLDADGLKTTPAGQAWRWPKKST